MQKNGKKEKTRVEVLRVAGIGNYIVDENGKRYLCNDKLAKDVKRGHFIKVRMEEGRVKKIIAIFG